MISPESPALAERRVIVWVARAISYLVYFYLIVVEIILLIGFFLLLFGANPSAGFTQWAYRNLDRVMDPFRGIFTPIELGTTSSDVQAVFDTSVLFAMIIYGIVALVLSGLIGWLTTRLHQIESAEEYNKRQAELEAHQAELDARQVELDAARQGVGTAGASPGYVPPASPVPGTEPGIASTPPTEP